METQLSGKQGILKFTIQKNKICTKLIIARIFLLVFSKIIIIFLKKSPIEKKHTFLQSRELFSSE